MLDLRDHAIERFREIAQLMLSVDRSLVREIACRGWKRALMQIMYGSRYRPGETDTPSDGDDLDDEKEPADDGDNGEDDACDPAAYQVRIELRNAGDEGKGDVFDFPVVVLES
jgi:hypothetical protein